MRRQLTILVVSVATAVILAFIVPLGLLVRTLAEDRAMTAASNQTHQLAFVAAVEDDPHRLVPALDVLNQQRTPRRTSVFLPDGEVLGAPAQRSAAVDASFRGASSSGPTEGGREVLVHVSGSGGRNLVIRTFIPDNLLDQGVMQSWLILAGLGAALLALAVAAADLMARQIARPIGELGLAATRMTTGDLDARVRPHGPPEVREVAIAFNALAARVGELLRAEREMVADLSHRLRTPITALRLDTDSLRDPEESARLAAHVDALRTAVDEVIQEARRPTRNDSLASCDAAEVLRERVAFWAVLAEDQGRPLVIDVPDGSCRVAVSREDLAAAVDALIGNVFQHTPESAAMGVGLTAANGQARVVVSDTGPGIHDPAAGERGHSGGGSTGLGLDIARRTAQEAGGRLQLDRGPNGRGTAVTLTLGTLSS